MAGFILRQNKTVCRDTKGFHYIYGMKMISCQRW